MEELFKNNAYRILELFIWHPTMNFYVRDIARRLKVSHATILPYIKKMFKMDIIKKEENTLYPTYYANTENSRYILYKKQYILSQIINSGLIESLQSKTLASCIILFGSCAKGSFNEQSDIDVYIESEPHSLDLKKYETLLKRKINILFEPQISSLSKELKNNIINGIILYGFINLSR